MPVTRFAYALMLLFVSLSPARAALPPVEAFGTTPVMDNVTLSLDGKFIASSYGGDNVSIVIFDRQQKKVTQRVAFDQGLKLRGIGFVSDHVLIARFSITYTQRGNSEQKSEIGATFAVNALDGSSRQLLEAKTNSRIYPSSGQFLSRHGAAPGEILMSALLLENATLRIGKGDRTASAAQALRNFRFFDAPVGLFFFIDAALAKGSWLDYGMFLQSFMLAARERGLHTCPQAAWLPYHALVRHHCGLQAERTLVCGMALGYLDASAHVNGFRTPRLPVDTFFTAHGFGEPA